MWTTRGLRLKNDVGRFVGVGLGGVAGVHLTEAIISLTLLL